MAIREFKLPRQGNLSVFCRAEDVFGVSAGACWLRDRDWRSSAVLHLRGGASIEVDGDAAELARELLGEAA